LNHHVSLKGCRGAVPVLRRSILPAGSGITRTDIPLLRYRRQCHGITPTEQTMTKKLLCTSKRLDGHVHISAGPKRRVKSCVQLIASIKTLCAIRMKKTCNDLRYISRQTRASDICYRGRFTKLPRPKIWIRCLIC
jgi:hypothetical protein